MHVYACFVKLMTFEHAAHVHTILTRLRVLSTSHDGTFN